MPRATIILRQLNSILGDLDIRASGAAKNKMLTLSTVEARLNSWLQPARNGEGWDNVGLLIGSEKEKDEKIVNRILLCNDLTLDVMDEAMAEKSDMIIAYHPPIFKALKMVGYGSWKERIVAKCLANDIVVFSPHTMLDSIPGGINDSFVKVLGRLRRLSEVKPIKSNYPEHLPRVSFRGDPSIFSEIFQRMAPAQHLMFGLHLDKAHIENGRLLGEGEMSIASESDIPLRAITTENILERPASDFHVVFSSVKDRDDGAGLEHGYFWPGSGRIVILETPIKIVEVVNAIKRELGVKYIQVAGSKGVESTASSFAICVGSGASLFSECRQDIECYITGEMSHHEILDIVNTKPGNKSLILCGHCSSERHYLTSLEKALHVILKGQGMPEIKISNADKSPLSLA